MSGVVVTVLAVIGLVTVVFSLAASFMLLGGWVIRRVRRHRRGTAVIRITPDTSGFREAMERAAEATRKAGGRFQ